MIVFASYICNRCDWEVPKELTESEAHDKVIDHIYGHSFITDYFSLNRERAKALQRFVFDQGYISYEFHPIMYDIMKDLNKFVEEKTNEG